MDIHSGRVLSYNYNTKKVNFVTLKGAVTPVIPAKNNENVLIVGVDRSLVALEWDSEKELGGQRVSPTKIFNFFYNLCFADVNNSVPTIPAKPI